MAHFRGKFTFNHVSNMQNIFLSLSLLRSSFVSNEWLVIMFVCAEAFQGDSQQS